MKGQRKEKVAREERVLTHERGLVNCFGSNYYGGNNIFSVTVRLKQTLENAVLHFLSMEYTITSSSDCSVIDSFR